MRRVCGFVLGVLIIPFAAGERPLANRTASIAAVAIAPGTSIVIDGQTGEETWARATAVTEFLQRDPREGEPATHATSVRVAYDDRALYVAVQADDPEPDQIVGILTRRDDQSPSDWVRVAIDSYRDRRTAYEFAVNAAGVKQDKYWFGDTRNDPSWDAVWDVAVARSPAGWSAEFRIPFSQLRFDPGSGDTFGFAVSRTVAHVNETATWPLLARSASGYVSSFGSLTGLAFGKEKRLEVMPYALGQVTTSPVASGNPLVSSPDPQATVGLDLKYKVAPGLTLTGTVNPDFGQVEADPAVVNLSAFETFFAERRPFFVEGSGNFSFNIDCEDDRCTGLFYSRRIGRAPQRVAGAPTDGYAAQPSNSTILGAAKLTGRVGRFSVGVLNAVTTREQADLAAGPGLERSTTPVEPATSYTVGRLSREFSNNSRLSFLLTSTNRALTDELRFLPGAAVTSGVDGDWRLPGGRYNVTGYWAGSTVRGSAAAIDRLQRSNVHSFQRPDADHLTYDPLRTSLSGHAGAASVGKISGQRVRFSSNASYKTPGFDINDLGFQRRADEIMQSNWFQVRNDTPGRIVRNRSVNVNQWAGWNFGGDRRFLGANINSHWTFVSNWQTGFGVNVNAAGLADRATRGGPLVVDPAALSGWGYLNSDNRRAVSLNLNMFGHRDRHGSSAWDFSPNVTWRPQTALSVGLGLGFGRNIADAQWIQNLTADGETRYLFGRLHQTTVRLSARVNYTITPTLSIQLYAQPFVSAGDYSDFKALADGRAARYEDRYAPYPYQANPDFNIRSFRTTNVLRWEYRPGSALFLVWQQGRDGFLPWGDFQFGRDFTGVFDTPATNVFLVKISRWFDY